MEKSIHHKIESFHQTTKTSTIYNNNINSFVAEYKLLNKCEVKKQVIDDVFQILCGKTFDEIIIYDKMVKMDTILIQNETIQELRKNYWDLRQEYLKLSKNKFI